MGGVPSLTLEYDYDSNGNRTDETRTEIALPGQPARTVHTHYGFDDDDRLTSAEVTYTPANPQTPNTRTVWTLDPVGNRLTEVVTNTQTNQALNSKTYTYSARDQLETVTDSVTQLRVVYGYDLNGNRTQRTVTRGPGNTLVSRTFYRFDARDRLVKAEPEAPNPTNIPTVEFVYDAEDRKIARIETPWLSGNPVPANAQATISLYDGQTLLHEAKPGSGSSSNSQGLIITDTYRNSAKLDRHVSYGPNGTDQPTIRFYQLDALGTPLILTDTNGQAIVSNTVDAWGNTVQQTADGNSTAPVNSGDQSQDPNQTGQAALLTNDDQTIGFTGYQKDEDLGLYYAGARFYDPLIGGFGGMDPFTGDSQVPITFNKYLYASANPVRYTDPTGWCSLENSIRCGYEQTAAMASNEQERQVAEASLAQYDAEAPQRADATVKGGILGSMLIPGGLALRGIYGVGRLTYLAWRAYGVRAAVATAAQSGAAAEATLGTAAALAGAGELPPTPLTPALPGGAGRIAGEMIDGIDSLVAGESRVLRGGGNVPSSPGMLPGQITGEIPVPTPTGPQIAAAQQLDSALGRSRVASELPSENSTGLRLDMSQGELDQSLDALTPRLGTANGSAPFVNFDSTTSLAPGSYRADPSQLRFTQSDASPNFTSGGTINSLVDDLRVGRVSADEVGDPLQIVMHNGKPFSIDNRRVVAFSHAGVSDVRIQVVSLDDPVVASRFFDRFDPIGGEGLQIVIASRRDRASAQQLLLEHSLIQGAQLEKK